MAASDQQLRWRPARTIGKKEGPKPQVAHYLLSFGSPKKSVTSKSVIDYLVPHLRSQGLSCRGVLTDDETVLIVSAEFDTLAKQAEKKKWQKPLKNSEEMIEFSVDAKDKFQPSDRQNFFSSAEKIRLLHHAIQDTTYDVAFLKKEGYEVEENKGLLTALLSSEPAVIHDAYPLHNPEEIKELSTMLKYSFVPSKWLSLDKIRNYFGEEVAFYFGWMNFYATCIIIPALVGLAMYLLRPSDTSVDTDPYLPFFSVIMAIWGVLFLIFWQRRCAVHSFQWNTYFLSTSDELRPEYHGNICTDPVTGKPTVYYPKWKRRLWYLFSFLAMLPLLALGVGMMTLSLNLNGYVKSTESPIYVEFLAQFAQPGGLFASDSPYFLWLVPTLVHSIIVNQINQLYSKVAERCTNLENHRTVHKWHSSLVVKRVFFECFDCFMPLFYIAFYQLDVVTLRAEIASLFTSDEIRRVTVETVIPFVKSLFVTKVKEKKGEKLGESHVPDTILAEYDEFDDYLEMVVQFGYITLFASAFPLGAVVTLLFLYVEVRSDFFKLIKAYRRPFPMRARNIGVWYDVMVVMVFTAILTNCAILGFSSEQLMQWMPWLFTRDASDGDQMMALGSGRYVVGIVFGFEHVLLVVSIFFYWAIQPVPKWVRLSIARREYLTKERLAKASGDQGKGGGQEERSTAAGSGTRAKSKEE